MTNRHGPRTVAPMWCMPASNALRSVACGGLIALAAVAPARAALFDDTEARQRIEQTNQRIDQVRKVLDERIAALEAQIKSQGMVDIFNQLEQVKRDMAQLRGQLEVITYELTEAQKRQRDLYVDLDSRLRRIESGGSSPAASGSAPPDQAPPGTGSTASFGPVGPGGAVPSSQGAARPADTAAEQRA